ncbi:MAG: hypothetical protein ACTSQP_10580 [Promethearchaeota archaeon]
MKTKLGFSCLSTGLVYNGEYLIKTCVGTGHDYPSLIIALLIILSQFLLLTKIIYYLFKMGAKWEKH